MQAWIDNLSGLILWRIFLDFLVHMGVLETSWQFLSEHSESEHAQRRMFTIEEIIHPQCPMAEKV
jgi:hypothetical protein